MTPLTQAWFDMGFMRYPLAVSLTFVLVMAAWSAVRLFEGGASADLRTKAWIDAILFWGGFAFVAGILGTLLGIVIAAQSIQLAGTAPTALVWGGVKVAMLTSVGGALILAFASVLWFLLQLRWRLLAASSAPS